MTDKADTHFLRTRIAARTPRLLRKAVRMAEHYLRRHRTWFHVLREMRGTRPRDRLLLLASAACAPLLSLRRLDGYQPPGLLRDLDLETTAGRFRVRAATDDILHVLKAREPHVWREIEHRLGKGGVFVDAGANIGFYSVLASRLVGPRGRVFAFEMMPETATLLRDHLALNRTGNVTVIERALSDREGESVPAHVPPGKYGQASIVAGAGAGETRRVTTTTLDAALADVPAIDLIKMDLEGAEYPALCGASQVLARTRAVIFESNSRDPRLPSLLQGAGFAVSPIGGHDYLAIRREA